MGFDLPELFLASAAISVAPYAAMAVWQKLRRRKTPWQSDMPE